MKKMRKIFKCVVLSLIGLTTIITTLAVTETPVFLWEI